MLYWKNIKAPVLLIGAVLVLKDEMSSVRRFRINLDKKCRDTPSCGRWLLIYLTPLLLLLLFRSPDVTIKISS